MKQYIATRALIKYQDKILIIKESNKYKDGSHPGEYDLPGGKVELGEDIKESLKREVEEETGLLAKIGELFFSAEWKPIIRRQKQKIKGVFFECQAMSVQVKLSKDHDDFKWIDPKDYKNHNLIEENNQALKVYLENHARSTSS